MHNYNLTHLEQLESEAIFILRETAAQFERPGLLFSGGKDSIVMAHLATKAFSPAKVPFPFVHVDTGYHRWCQPCRKNARYWPCQLSRRVSRG